jgi:hypothetical protein
MYSNRSFGYLLPTPSKSPRSSKKMCCQIPDGFKVDRKVHGCAIGGVKGGSPSRSVRAHWLVVGAVAGWGVLLAETGGRCPPNFKQQNTPSKRCLEDGRVHVAVPPLKESCVLRQGCKFTLMIIVVCTRFYLIYNRTGSPNT